MSKTVLLQNEKQKSEQYMLKVDNNGKVVIDKDNVYKVLAMICENSSYCRVCDKNFEGELKNNKTTPLMENNRITEDNVDDNSNYKDGHFGSSAYWFSKLNEAKPGDEFKYYLFKTICAVDNENSTHLNGDYKTGRIEIWHRICKITNNDVNSLKELLISENLSDENKMVLIKKISAITNPSNGKK